MNSNEPTQSLETPAPKSERYYGLDAARAVAMLLGVFYHLPIAFMGGGMFGGPPSPKTNIDNWLHSFRMPLFFLISGFFACMMLEKYGIGRYYLRRCRRIGGALFVSLLLLVGFRWGVEQYQNSRPAQPPPAFPGGGFFGPMGPMPGAPGMGPPTRPGAPNAPGTPNVNPGFGMGGNGAPPMPGFGMGGPTARGPQPNIPFQFPGMPSRAWSNFLFGKFSKHMMLEHLWFLWYLLVMIVFAPIVAYVLGAIAKQTHRITGGRIARFVVHWNLLGMVIGGVGLPLLLHAKGFMGWSLANPHGFLSAFPDMFVQYCPDWPHYAWYFAIGWWIFACKTCLPVFERHWKWSLAIGILGFVVSQWLSSTYSMSKDQPNLAWIRLGAFWLYGMGAAYSALGFLGGFQKHMNQPNRVMRYLADSALWVYLVHLPLIPYVIGWVEPWRTTWWEGTIGGMVLVTGICLVLYELVVKPTPLKYVYR
jgi:peptidoglycan/LPS O-acetylase OafA/YrhL